MWNAPFTSRYTSPQPVETRPSAKRLGLVYKIDMNRWNENGPTSRTTAS